MTHIKKFAAWNANELVEITQEVKLFLIHFKIHNNNIGDSHHLKCYL